MLKVRHNRFSSTTTIPKTAMMMTLSELRRHLMEASARDDDDPSVFSSELTGGVCRFETCRQKKWYRKVKPFQFSFLRRLPGDDSDDIVCSCGIVEASMFTCCIPGRFRKCFLLHRWRDHRSFDNIVSFGLDGFAGNVLKSTKYEVWYKVRPGLPVLNALQVKVWKDF